MNNKKVPMITCVVTKEKTEKKNLIRIVRTTEGKIEIDLTGKLNGRGCYLTKDKEVILKAKKNKILDRTLETEVEEKIYNDLLEII